MLQSRLKVGLANCRVMHNDFREKIAFAGHFVLSVQHRSMAHYQEGSDSLPSYIRYIVMCTVSREDGFWCVRVQLEIWGPCKCKLHIGGWNNAPVQKSQFLDYLSLGTCESGIFVRIESRIESGCSRLRVQCRLPQELCRPTAYTTGNYPTATACYVVMSLKL